ncbi:MAG TPA: alkaline phosphatase family protein [Gaiellaceae bacterium]|nr:alkaline phosphatase family protein [Gaiellaceae bacterium]
MPKKLLLVVIDGLTPAMLEAGIERGSAPTLGLLAEHGSYGRAVSAFPSLTPVCLSSIATGAHPDVHEIPHLVWYHRGERRLVEYGSSFGAIVAAGFGRSLRDSVLEMNRAHLGEGAVTLFESLEDAGLVPAAVNFTCYRGRTRHLASVPGVPAVNGPRRFFYYNLFESDFTGAPLAVRSRARGTIDAYAAAAARWLVTRDGFDALVLYLSDYDYASHASGPDTAHAVLSRCDAHLRGVVDAAGGIDEFLERYAVLVCSDHGQTHVERGVRLEEPLAGVDGVLVTASNRAAMVYRLPNCRLDPRELAARLDGQAAAEVVLFREGGDAVARREGEELRFAPAADGWATAGDASILDHPDALERTWRALRNPNAGDLLVSAAPGLEFCDLAGRSHAGGGSHGSLVAADSEVPVLAVGLERLPRSIAEIAPLALEHFGLEPPAYARPLSRAA